MVAVGAVPSQSKTKVCVKKSSGEMRLLTKKKCKKGWKKITWNQKGSTGPQGDQGAQGPNLTVKRAASPAGIPLMFVEINGGIFLYGPNGQIFPASRRRQTSTCDGHLESSSPQTTQLITQSAGGPGRIMHRVTNPAPGAIKAWSLTATTETVNQMMYKLNDTGACVVDFITMAPWCRTAIGRRSPVRSPPGRR